jgi:hypothetical protein
VEALHRIRRDIKLGTWNIRSLYRAGSLKAAAKELARYKLDVVGVEEVRWDKEGVARMGEERGAYRVLVGKPEGKRPLGRPRRRWVDNIRMDLQEVGCGYMDWIGLAQDRDGWRKLECSNESSGSIQCGEFLD